ncbi:MAG TPA: hypothetical protein VEK77_13095 [Gemmatimonadales bacterium]|nr:hypothetical protein [Gemmatimonadales bacterium]
MTTKPGAAAPATPGTAVTAPRATLLERLLALAQTPEERERAFALTERVQQQQVLAELSEQIAATSWGEKLSPALRAQVIRYALDVGADPARHLFVLGGRPYLNATFYKELVAAQADFQRDEVQFVHDDERASPEEREERRRLRVVYAVPEKVGERAVLAAAVVTLHFEDRGPFIGVKWAPSSKTDPVGTEFPVHSAESRAYRKAAEKAVSAWFTPERTHRLQRIEQLIEAQKLGPQGPAARAPAPVAVEAVDVAPLPAGAPAVGAEPEPARVGVIERHNPSARCSIEGEHRREDCGYFKGKAGT